MSPEGRTLGPLRKKRLKELITDEFVGTGRVLTREEIAKTCLDIHLNQGGSKPGTQIGKLTGRALADLRDQDGLVRWGGKDVWIFDVGPPQRASDPVPPRFESEHASPVEDQAPPSGEDFPEVPSTVEDLPLAPEFRAIGQGSETVYAYYFPVYRERADWLNHSEWEIKVGMSTGDPMVRMEKQSMSPETPTFLLEVRCRSAQRVERGLHDALKERGHWIETRAKGGPAVGTEWFRISPEELFGIAVGVLSNLGIPIEPDSEDSGF